MNPLYFTIFCGLKSLKLKVYLQKSLALDVTSPIKVKFSWIEQIHCYICPHTNIKSSTQRNPQTFWQPSSILSVWSGRVRRSGMTTWQLWYLRTRSLGPEAAWIWGCFPGGSDPCLKGCSVVQSEDCWSLAELPAWAMLLFSSWQTTEEEGDVSRRLIICIWTWPLTVWGKGNQRKKQKQRGRKKKCKN